MGFGTAVSLVFLIGIARHRAPGGGWAGAAVSAAMLSGLFGGAAGLLDGQVALAMRDHRAAAWPVFRTAAVGGYAAGTLAAGLLYVLV